MAFVHSRRQCSPNALAHIVRDITYASPPMCKNTGHPIPLGRKHPLLKFAAMVIFALANTSLLAQDPREAPIRAIVENQALAWNAGDGPAYAREVSPDVSFTNLFGMVLYGKEPFVKRHSEILATFYKGTTKHHSIRRIRFITPDVAIVDIDNEVRGVKAMPGGIPVPPDGIIKTQLMEIFVRRDGKWWIEAYHNVDVKPSK